MSYHSGKCFRHRHNVAPYSFTLVQRTRTGALVMRRRDVPMCTVCRNIARRAWRTKLHNLQLSGTNALRIALNEAFLIERVRLLDARD